jgi:ADP-ribosylglycohydrolase
MHYRRGTGAVVVWMGVALAASGASGAGAAPDEICSRVLGCLVGNSLGDAFGGVIEFAPAERVIAIAGKPWVDRFLPYAKDHAPHPWGVWEAAPPRGTGTDDTRINQIFVECVIRNKGFINSQFLAIEYIERYRDREKLYPRHAALAEEHLSWFFGQACGSLGMCELPSGKVITAEKDPTLIGLISLAPAGLLYRGEPEKAYRKVFELDFIDVGYGKDAAAMLAAMISAGLGGNASAKEMVRIGLETDPLGYGTSRPVAASIRRFLQIADKARDDQSLINALAAEAKDVHVFNPIDALGVAVAAFYHSDGDPVRTIIMAANDRELDEKGNLRKLRDVDCVASVAGALVGVLRGAEAFPADWARDTIAANKQVYGIDLEANAKRFCEAVYGAKK